ncbi:MAG: putative rane protein [Candidatus Saccharibacteria bacterium]|nr:putative rane protein [Candidatus Saccharibacteria bacterium]
MIQKLAQHQIIRYLFIGGLSYAIEISVLFSLNQILHIQPTISVAISFWVGFIVAYTLQKIITFQNKEKSRRAIAKQLIGYSLLVLWNYTFTLLVVEFFHNNIPVVILRTMVIIITTLWNYALYKVLFKATTK